MALPLPGAPHQPRVHQLRSLDEDQLPRQMIKIGPQLAEKILEFMPTWRANISEVNQRLNTIHKQREYPLRYAMLERMSTNHFLRLLFPQVLTRPYNPSHVNYINHCLTNALKVLPGGAAALQSVKERYDGFGNHLGHEAKLGALAEETAARIRSFEKRVPEWLSLLLNINTVIALPFHTFIGYFRICEGAPYCFNLIVGVIALILSIPTAILSLPFWLVFITAHIVLNLQHKRQCERANTEIPLLFDIPLAELRQRLERPVEIEVQ